MNTKARVFAHLEQHPDTDNAQLYEALPDVSQGVLRTYAAKFRNQGDTPSDQRQTSILPESDMPSPPPKPSKANPDLDWLKANRKPLEAMLGKYKAGASIPAGKGPSNVEISGDTKGVTYNVAKALHTEFTKAARRSGLSQRKAIHAAMRMFVEAVR